MNELRTTTILSFMRFWLLPAVIGVADIGTEDGTQVADYGGFGKFPGKVEKVKMETKK